MASMHAPTGLIYTSNDELIRLIFSMRFLTTRPRSYLSLRIISSCGLLRVFARRLFRLSHFDAKCATRQYGASFLTECDTLYFGLIRILAGADIASAPWRRTSD